LTTQNENKILVGAPITGTNTKEADVDRARMQNQQRPEDLADQGRRFRNFLEWEACWYLETFQCDRFSRLLLVRLFQQTTSGSVSEVPR
jgi:hypothetical protein